MINESIKHRALPSILPSSYLMEKVKNLKSKGLPKGFNTGIESLDKVMRLDKGRLITVTGIPNCGKSEFVDFLCTTYNRLYGLKTLYFSPENQPVELHIAKIASKTLEKNFDEIKDDELDKVMHYINKNFFFLNYDRVKTLDSIIESMENSINLIRPDILVLDAYNKIESDKQSTELETEFISKVLDRLHATAIKHNIMVILVAHPRKMEWDARSATAKMPTAYDICGSAHFFNKSDFVIVVHRNRGGAIENDSVTIRVDKVKFSSYGNQGQTELMYHQPSGNYFDTDMEKQLDEPFSKSLSPAIYTSHGFVLSEVADRKNPLQVEVSMYRNVTDNEGVPYPLEAFLLSDEHKELVKSIRKGNTPEERHDLKEAYRNRIPAITVGGIFEKRDGKHLIKPSGLISIDIDWKDNKEIMPKIPSILKGLPYVAYAGKSLSGDGYFAIIPIENPSHFKEHYFALEQEMKSYGITLDKSCKDITRLRFVSYDPDCFYNPEASTYYWEVDTSTTSTSKVCKPKYVATSSVSSWEQVQKEIEWLKNQKVSLSDDYNTWFRTGMALNNEFGENGRALFHELSKLSNKYDEETCNKQYDEIISHYTDDCKIQLGTLYHIIKEAKELTLKNRKHERY